AVMKTQSATRQREILPHAFLEGIIAFPPGCGYVDVPADTTGRQCIKNMSGSNAENYMVFSSTTTAGKTPETSGGTRR
ncbi:MAG: hypothetical protein J6D54_11940, partial [Olsenella sp.]|nr:hypothetical protein [Olsenella sp.]